MLSLAARAEEEHSCSGFYQSVKDILKHWEWSPRTVAEHECSVKSSFFRQSLIFLIKTGYISLHLYKRSLKGFVISKLTEFRIEFKLWRNLTRNFSRVCAHKMKKKNRNYNILYYNKKHYPKLEQNHAQRLVKTAGRPPMKQMTILNAAEREDRNASIKIGLRLYFTRGWWTEARLCYLIFVTTVVVTSVCNSYYSCRSYGFPEKKIEIWITDFYLFH